MDDSDLERTRRERDLYRRLLDLGSQRELEPFLKEALALVVELTGARQGYLEIRDPQGSDDAPDWFIADGFSEREVDDVRSRMSRGIVAEALATGRVVDTPSAIDDARFLARESVRASRIQAVLCVPVGREPVRGALYLQGRGEGGAFSPEDRVSAELFAARLAPLTDNVLLRHRTRDAEDPTAPYRARLRADSVIGRTPALARLLEAVGLVAPLDVHVLLTGESGTGKSQIARVIHDNGPRRDGPFVELNCSALPESLFESELFGARAGSHSTATRDLSGKVAAAASGTLFLDEIGELAPGSQAKLLQLLQSGDYYPLGSTEPERADVRILAATNADLQAAVDAGAFRVDLLFRLQVLPVHVPTLRERHEDVVELARFFLTRASARHRLGQLGLSPGASRAIEAAEWPGNIRQLDHAIEAAAIRAAGGGADQVEAAHVFPETTHPDEESAATFQEQTRRFQDALIGQTLQELDWDVRQAAERLDLARSYVYKRIRAGGLKRDG